MTFVLNLVYKIIPTWKLSDCQGVGRVMGWEGVNDRMGGVANGEVLAFGGVEV